MMKNLLVCSAMVILSSLFYSLESFAGKKLKVYKVCKLKSGTTLKIYLHPTVHSRTVAKLNRNSRWIIKRKGKKNYRHSRWQKISWNKNTGWIKNSCLKFDKKASNIASRKPDCLNSKTRTKDCEREDKTAMK